MDFSSIFENYEIEAFRLETLRQYKVEGEWENFCLYKEEGVIKQDKDLIDYINSCQTKIGDGKRHIRTRVYQNPIADYLKFETQVGYIPQSKVGFELNFIEIERVRGLLEEHRLNEIKLQDFWLFDKKYLYYFIYSTDGEFLDIIQENEERKISQFIDFRNLLIKNSHTLSYFLDTYF